MENLIRIRRVPYIGTSGKNVLSSMMITSHRTLITKNTAASSSEVFLSPFYARKLAIYCDKKLILKNR